MTLVFFFVLILSLSAAFIDESGADLIGDVCSASVNPSLCDSSLRSDPRSKGGDLRTLGLVAVDKASSATSATIKMANSFAATSPEKVAGCVGGCNKAIGVLNECRKILSGGSSAGIPGKATAALTYISTCDTEFGRFEPPQLREASAKAEALANVIYVIGNRL